MEKKSIYILASGNTAVFDIEGKQIADIQTNIVSDYLKSIADKGYNFDNAEILLNALPIKPFKTEDGYNF